MVKINLLHFLPFEIIAIGLQTCQLLNNKIDQNWRASNSNGQIYYLFISFNNLLLFSYVLCNSHEKSSIVLYFLSALQSCAEWLTSGRNFPPILPCWKWRKTRITTLGLCTAKFWELWLKCLTIMPIGKDFNFLISWSHPGVRQP